MEASQLARLTKDMNTLQREILSVTTIMSEALIVDDNFHNRHVFRIALEGVGYAITEAENGVEGLKLLEERMFHLLVLDLQMPLMDGVTVLRELQNMRVHKQMRIIVVTANAHMTTGDVDDLADYIMYKPINVVQFAGFAGRLRNISLPE